MLDPAMYARPIAHRGLHDAQRGIIENTTPAFEAAMARGYGIECDLRPAAGGLPIVFHDERLDRLIAGAGLVTAVSGDDLKALRYRIGGSAISTFADLLALVRGRVPLFVEIKSEWEPPDTLFVVQIAELAQVYAGPLAVMSFDPDVMAAVAERAPSVPRGIVSGRYDGPGWWSDKVSPARARELRDLKNLGRADPHFYAYDINALPSPAIDRVRSEGHPILTWTVRTPEQRARAAASADQIIFEGFTP